MVADTRGDDSTGTDPVAQPGPDERHPGRAPGRTDGARAREAEAALRASEERYRLLFDRNPMPMWVYDRTTLRFLAVNEAAVRQYGYTADEFLNMTIADIRPPEDVARLRDAVAAAPQGLHRNAGWQHRRRDGTLLDVDIVAYPIRFEDRDAELVLADDVTLRRRAEVELRATAEILRAVVDDSPVAIISADLELRITRWNPAAERLLGWSAAEVVGRSFLIIVPEEEQDDHHALREAALRGEPAGTYETRRRRKDGSLVDIGVSLGALHDEAGAVNGFVAIISDMTERKQLEKRLFRSQKMEAVGQLAGGIAHDFNNLLTAITSYSQLLLDDMTPGDPRRPDVHEIRRAGERAAALTRQLLAFSRQQVVQPRVLSVNAIVLEIEKMLRRLVREDVEFRLLLDPALGAIEADPGQIEQVIVNLVVNARDAMPDGGTVLIETSNTEFSDESMRLSGDPAVPPGRYVMLSVTDTGSGMSEDVQSHIFEPFFTTRDPGRGTGLGLATVYGIVRQAKGQISVYSEPGRGARFKILLPRVDAPAASLTPHAGEGAPAPRGEETVLLVEDDDAVRAVARRILARQGYTLLEARTGGEALAILEARAAPVDLVLSDMVMPGMSGAELADHLHGLQPGLRILLMSGYSRHAATQLARFEPGTGYIEKPFTPQRLATRVRELLDEKSGPADHT
jgi:two-component system cell cycle sensor histidine kinase/response regulator CckA